MKISAKRVTYELPRWFSVDRYWSGKLIYITVLKRWGIHIDIRKDWISDMTNGRVKMPKKAKP